MLTDQQQIEADRLAGQYETLLDRVVAAGYNNRLSNDEEAELRIEMSVLSSEYFDLTGEQPK
jgi:hypothetical protein